MPNYYKECYNQFIDHAMEIYEYLSGTYMDVYDSRWIDVQEPGFEVGKLQFIQVLRYRRTGSPQSDFDHINSAMQMNLRYCAGLGVSFGYFIVSCNAEITIYLGIEEESTERFISNMRAAIPDVVVSKGFISSMALQKVSAHCGMIHGNISFQKVMLDKILSTFSNVNGIIALIAKPMVRRDVSRYALELSHLKQMTERLMGNETPPNLRTELIRHSWIPKLDSFLESSINYYEDASEEFWRYCMWFGSDDRQDLEYLGNSLRAVLNSHNINKIDKARCHYTLRNPFRYGSLFLPITDYSKLRYEISDALKKPSLISYIATSDLASFIQLPSVSVNGLEVIQMEKEKDSVNLFEINYGRKPRRGILLGVDHRLGIPYYLNVDDLTEHLLVTGATGAGKTNTVMLLTRGIHDAGIPLLIIEPSKKDYWHLGSIMRKLRIFSFGKDAELLKINPLIPEEGIIIANHIDNLLYAFSGAFDMEPPTKFALDGLLKYTYERFGWKMDEITYHSNRKFPKISDMLSLLPEYMNLHLPYGEEVKSNILGSIVNRLSSLNSGMIGESVNSSEVISGKELCSGTVLIELDDLSLEVKPFVAMLIMIKVEQYLRRQDASSVLRNAIVLEEAHNIFANVSDKTVSNTKKMASDFFSNMLSQIREYGVGIITADQGASRINDVVVSNSKIKITQSVVDSKDMEKIAFALNLSDVQKRVFPSLRTGEAIVSVRGNHIVSRIIVNRSEEKKIENIACIFCTKRLFCNRFNSVDMMPISRKMIYAQNIYDIRFNTMQLKNMVDMLAERLEWPSDWSLCLLGDLLSDESIRCGEREKRRIVETYLNHVGGVKGCEVC